MCKACSLGIQIEAKVARRLEHERSLNAPKKRVVEGARACGWTRMNGEMVGAFASATNENG
jgi:hypothetical protein